jgi:hypothetical protein
MPTKNEEQVLSKQGEPIEEDDHVYTKIRGGRHEGDVSTIYLVSSLGLWDGECSRAFHAAEMIIIMLRSRRSSFRNKKQKRRI